MGRGFVGKLAIWRGLKRRSRFIASTSSRIREPGYRVLETIFKRGIRMRLPTGDEFSLHPRFLGWKLEKYEPEVMSFIANRLKPESLFVDVGAHVGLYALMASRRVGSAGRVFAVEPSPANFSLLGSHLAWNACDNVRPILAAVAETAGRTTFTFRPSATDPGACANSLAYEIEEGVKAEVALITLDELCETRIPDFLKIDVEGAEWLVLRGGTKTLAQRRAVVVCAMHPEPLAALGGTTRDVVNWMGEMGYGATRLDGAPVSAPGFEEVVFTPRTR